MTVRSAVAAVILVGACTSNHEATIVDASAVADQSAEFRRLCAALGAAADREDFREAERLAAKIGALSGDLARAVKDRGATEPAFAILDARWGADTRWTNVSDKARSLARPTGLAVVNDYQAWGDPAPGEKKTLVLVYRDHGALRTAVVYEDSEVRVP